MPGIGMLLLLAVHPIAIATAAWRDRRAARIGAFLAWTAAATSRPAAMTPHRNDVIAAGGGVVTYPPFCPARTAR